MNYSVMDGFVIQQREKWKARKKSEESKIRKTDMRMMRDRELIPETVKHVERSVVMTMQVAEQTSRMSECCKELEQR